MTSNNIAQNVYGHSVWFNCQIDTKYNDEYEFWTYQIIDTRTSLPVLISGGASTELDAISRAKELIQSEIDDLQNAHFVRLKYPLTLDYFCNHCGCSMQKEYRIDDVFTINEKYSDTECLDVTWYGYVRGDELHKSFFEREYNYTLCNDDYPNLQELFERYYPKVV